MNLDILSTYSYTKFNIRLANIVGLHPAIYLSVVLDALNQAVKKGKVGEDGYFKLDRKYVNEKTTLSTSEQKDCDVILMKAGLLERKPDKLDNLKVAVQGIVELLQTDDESTIAHIQEEISKIKKADRDAAYADALSRALKNKVKETDFELREAWFGWVDSLQGKANVKTVEIAEAALAKYTSSKQVKLAVLEKATINGYRDITWAISLVEKDKNYSGKNFLTNRLTATKPNVATSKADINPNIKF